MRVIANTILLLAVVLWINPVQAGYISISTGASDCLIIEDSCPLALSIANRGDEAAYDVLLTFLLEEGFETESATVGTLEVNATSQNMIKISKTKSKLPGTHRGVLLIEYKDANSHKFSAIVPFKIIYKQGTESPISGSMEGVKLEGKKPQTLRLRMKNSEDLAHKANVELFISKELTTKDSRRKMEVEIPPSGEEIVEFEINSLSALPGSTYPVLALISHENDGKFYSTFARGVVRVEKESLVFSEGKMLVVLAILLVAFIFFQVKDIKWKR
ncbi:MAG: hypothetical protein V3R86_04370 [Candidatus Hydrothermarchaeaceae archaeon]